MAKLHDQHLHSRHSMDSTTDPRENCVGAIARGLRGLTFTEHYDMHPEERPGCIWDYAAIADTIGELREKFADRIEVGFGIEVCYQPGEMPGILDYLAAHDFDVVLLSIHWCGGKRLHVRDDWAGLDHKDMGRVYFQAVLEAVRLCLKLREAGERPFDVLGHPDLAKRYARRYWKAFDVREHADVIDEIWHTALAADIVPEINLSTLRDSVGEPMPGEWTIERYVEAGGRAMSIGSDGHRSDHIGAGFDEAAGILQRAGIESEAVFAKRQRALIPVA